MLFSYTRTLLLYSIRLHRCDLEGGAVPKKKAKMKRTYYKSEILRNSFDNSEGLNYSFEEQTLC